MKLPVHVRVRPDGVQAVCPDLPGCAAVARTEPEAIARLRERIDAWFADTIRTAPTGTRVLYIEV